jgi:hypothetical protein
VNPATQISNQELEELKILANAKKLIDRDKQLTNPSSK